MSRLNVADALRQAGARFSGGRWLRLKDRGLDSISINRESGGWRDHRTGEHGSWRKLAEKIPGLDPAVEVSTAPYDKEAEARSDAWAMQQARNMWSRGVPALSPRKPSGWAQARWDAEQERHQDAREAIYDYLQGRGLDPLPLLPLIRFSTAFSERSAMDLEMLDAGADFWFMIPMYRIGKNQIAGNVCGIQRTYLSFGDGKYQPAPRKVGRAMMGRKGVTTLQPGEGRPVIPLPAQGAVWAVGEGMETVASWWQVFNRPATITWDWTGLRAWTEALRPIAGAPIVAVLVDNDASETGQRESAAAVRLIGEHEHGRAVYLLPPDEIQPDAKGNRDWNDALRQGGAGAFARQIVEAWHASDETMALAPAQEQDSPVSSRLEAAENPQTVAEAVALEVAQAQVRNGVEEHARAWQDFQIQVAEWKALPDEERRRTKRPPEPATTLIKVTTGVGKSHAIRAIINDPAYRKIGFLILTRTHDLAEEYAAAGAFQYFGRGEAPAAPCNGGHGYAKQEVQSFPENTCLKYPVVQITSANNHVPALTACRSCEYGRKFMLEQYDPRSTPNRDAQEWFRSNGFPQKRIDDLPACLWLTHQAQAQRARVVAAPNAALSETLATWNDFGDLKPRLIVVDEIPDITRPITVTTRDLGIHSQRCAGLTEKMEAELAEFSEINSMDDAAPMRGQRGTVEALLADMQTGQRVLAGIALALGRSVADPDHQQRLPDDLIEQIKSLRVDWLPGATARWEKAELKYGHEPFVPLRALKGIIESVNTNTHMVQAGVLQVRDVTALGEMISKGKPVLLLDATPSQAVEYAVQAKGGRIIHAIARQNVRIVHFDQYLHGRTWKNDQHKQSELRSLETLRAAMQEETGSEPVTHTYMKLCQLAQNTDNPDWGYWGRDDIGHDRWNSSDILCFGGQILSPQATAEKYNSELMIRRMSGDTDSPDWAPEAERGQAVTVGQVVRRAAAPLPTNPVLRDWLLAEYCRSMAQLIGRGRGARSARTLNVWIAGGLPLAGLAQHGLDVAEYRRENEINLREDAKREADRKVQIAMAALAAGDSDHSYRDVQKWLQDHGMADVRYDAWKRHQQGVYGLDKDSIEPVDRLLDALNQIDREAMAGEITLADAALSAWERQQSSKLTRFAAGIILEAHPDSWEWREGQRQGRG